MAEQILGWNDLSCDCGISEFVPVMTVKGHIKLGITSQQTGWQCRQCRRLLNTGNAMNRLRRRALEDEVNALKEQLDNT